MRHAAGTLLLLLGLAAAAAPAAALDEKLISIETPRGVTQKFLLLTPDKPMAAVILFAGGHGGLGLSGPNAMAWGQSNFVVRTREEFAAHGLLVAVVDAPSDLSKMSAKWRIGPGHAQDIAAVVTFLKQQANVPVWLVGTSMGTFSAAGGAIGAEGVDGLVLTSTVTRSRPEWNTAASHPDGVASMELGKIAVPTLVLSHKKDGCEVTPPADAAKLKAGLTNAPKVETMLLDGGSPPKSKPCQAMSQHGFLGIERQAVAAIAAFIKAGRN